MLSIDLQNNEQVFLYCKSLSLLHVCMLSTASVLHCRITQSMMCVCLLSVQISQESALHELTLFATYVTLDATSDLTVDATSDLTLDATSDLTLDATSDVTLDATSDLTLFVGCCLATNC